MTLVSGTWMNVENKIWEQSDPSEALITTKEQPLKPVLGGVRDVAHIQYPSCTDSIKPSLQFLCYFVVINASEGSLCFQICSMKFH
jgi:hypothetical protein